jgi:thiamine-phosphate pyrophosphorylase
MIDFRLCLVTDRRRCPLLERVVDSACRVGVRAVQLREKDLEAKHLLELAQRLRRTTSAHGARLFVNDRVDVTMASGADGVHCPEDGFPPRLARRLLGRDTIVGASCHSAESVERAADDGVDLVFYGPVFSTPSKAAYGPSLGLDALRNVCGRVGLPVFAIGGVTPERSVGCMENGASGVAVVSALLASDDLESSVSAFERALGGL